MNQIHATFLFQKILSLLFHLSYVIFLRLDFEAVLIQSHSGPFKNIWSIYKLKSHNNRLNTTDSLIFYMWGMWIIYSI